VSEILTNKTISLIAAMDENGIIGRGNRFPWNPKSVPSDMEHFVKLTEGKALIVGRKTGESLPPSMLKRIPIIILTRNPNVPDDAGYQTAGTVEEAISLAEEAVPDASEIMVGGGAEIYELFQPLARRFYCTVIKKVFQEKEGDVYFPFLLSWLMDWEVKSSEICRAEEFGDKWNLQFSTMERKA
jgi:dihydrofolate reductase